MVLNSSIVTEQVLRSLRKDEMPKLIIANSRTEEMVGDLALLTEEERGLGAWGAQRMLWFTEDGDVVVLPWVAEDPYVNYTLGLIGTDRASLSFVVPPPGYLGTELLTPDRLADDTFRSELRAIIAGRPIDRVLAAYDDDSVVGLAAAMGLRHALPGHDFSAQGGGALVNSKAAFRAVAAGLGVPVAPGGIASRPHQAVTAIEGLLGVGHDVIVKKAVAGGGFGNEILIRSGSVKPAGARNVITLADEGAVGGYVEERWSWMTGGRNAPVVIERYFAGSTTVYAEFFATDGECQLMGTGEILMEPIANGEVVPPQSIPKDTHDILIDGARRLCEAFRTIGYRGTICADAIWTSDGQLIFSETNGRITGSTHLHTTIPERVIGPAFRDRRVRLEHIGWPASSFADGTAQLLAAGLAFDPQTRTGVVFTGNYVPVNGKIMYCVIAEDFETAVEIERRISAFTAKAAD